MAPNPAFSPPLPAEFIERLGSAAAYQPTGGLEIKITNMRLRTFIGINEWEQEHRQDLVLNLKISCDPATLKSCLSDDIKDTVNYKNISKQVISYVEGHRFLLLEKLIAGVMQIVLAEPGVVSARVLGEKPGALRFSDSVGVGISGANTAN